MLAILSDIHANLEALQSVLDDIDARSISTVYCLGDLVGYGPDPSACIELARQFDLCLGGNWERSIGSTPIPEAENRIERLRQQYQWIRDHISPGQLEFLSGLTPCKQQNSMTFAHGSPLDYVNDYLFPEHIYDTDHMNRVFSAFDGIFVCGHTHIAGIHLHSKYFEPQAVDFRFYPNGNSSIINVGSVGQPRDNDPRACYVIYDGESFEFIRVDYDSDATRRKLEGFGFGPGGSDT